MRGRKDGRKDREMWREQGILYLCVTKGSEGARQGMRKGMKEERKGARMER